MAPTSTSVNIKLTEPVIFLIGGTEHERARARRRRGTRNTNSNNTPSISRPTSRNASPAPGNSSSTSGQQPIINSSGNNPLLEEFVNPGPSRARDRDRRNDSPSGLGGNGGGGSRSGSRARGIEGLTTGSGTLEEAEEADEPAPAMLRGLLILTLAKPSRIRDISLKLKGIARTDWPEGIGPRRLDVLEETVLTSTSWSFFTASESERRAVSIGPGVREHNEITLDDRGRTGSRRSASMMPTRDTSTGLSYSARDSAIHEDELEDSVPTSTTTANLNSTRPIPAPLSRIASSSNITSSPISLSPITPTSNFSKATDEWGPSPAYEAVSSVPNSPAQGPSSIPYSTVPPTLGRMNSLDSFELNSSRHSSNNSGTTSNVGGVLRTRTPSRSPLNPSNSYDSNSGPGNRPSTGRSQLSQEEHDSPDRDSQERSIVQTTNTTTSTSSAARPTLVHMSSSGGDSLIENSPWTSASSTEALGSSANNEIETGEREERGRPSRRDPPSRNSNGHSTSASLASIGGGGSGSDTNTNTPPIIKPSQPSNTSNSTSTTLLQTQRLSLSDSINTNNNNSSQSSLTNQLPPSPALTSPALYRVISPETLNGGRSSSMSSTTRKVSGSSASVGPPPARSASSRPNGRFSLAGLSDKLRGKSSSRARDSSTSGSKFNGLDEELTRGGRTESPDSRGGGGRDQSRGRRTALKSLRDALTSPMEVGEEEESGDEFENEDNTDGKGKGKSKAWREFKAGTYTYPISIPIPASLPPSINADFGNVTYMLKATIHRAGALTTNLTNSTEVVLVSAPGLDDTEENESIVVERYWETQMRYHIALSGKSFLVGGTIPIAIRLHPLAKIKLYRITITLEQKTNYFASGRKLTRHETPKKFPLLRIENKDPKEALLPIFTDGANAIHDHPLGSFFINPTSSDDTTPSLLDPIGPWFLEGTLRLPACASRCNFSTNHEKANISVSHMLKIVLRVERGDDDFMDSKGKRKLWDVIIETPVHILSCKCSRNTLPAYSYTPPGAGPSGSISSTLSSTPNAFSVPDCGFNHSASAPSILTPQHANLARAAIRPTTPLNQNQIDPNTTLAQSLLFARLVAGEETPNGEVPPTYDAAIHSSPTVGTGPIGTALERSRSSSSSISSSIMTARVGRPGRSSSAVSGGSGGGSPGNVTGGTSSRGRSASSNFGRSPSSHNGRSMSASQNGRSLSTSTSGGGRSDSIPAGDERTGRSGSVGVVVRAGRSGSIVTMRGEADQEY